MWKAIILLIKKIFLKNRSTFYLNIRQAIFLRVNIKFSDVSCFVFAISVVPSMAGDSPRDEPLAVSTGKAGLDHSPDKLLFFRH